MTLPGNTTPITTPGSSHTPLQARRAKLYLWLAPRRKGEVGGQWTFTPDILASTNGVWSFRVRSGVKEPEGGDCFLTDITSLSSKGVWSNTVTYLHGKPDAPEGFAYAMSGTNHLLTWKKEIPTDLAQGSRLITCGGPQTTPTWWQQSGSLRRILAGDFYRLTTAQADLLEDGKTYTFELTAIHGSEEFQGAKLASDPATVMVMIGDPVPTLPEIALLLLAMLLLGSGAYLLRAGSRAA